MIATGSLQIFSGTLTEITCSADVPVFHLMTEEGMEYDERDYSQLPGLLDIEAVVSPDDNNVTLLVNGTNRSNNVTVMCGHLRNAVRGQIETIFTLVLEFVSTLPPPNNVHHTSQGPGGRPQIMWQPPTLFTPQNVSVDSRITHYVVSIISENTMIISIEAPETSFSPELDNVSCRFSFQVAAVNPAGIGEHSHLQNVEWCTEYTSSTAVSESVPTSNGLSAGELIAVTIIVPVSIIAVISVTLIIFIIAKFKIDGHQQVIHIQSLESELSEISDPKNTSTLPDKHIEAVPSNSNNDDNNNINVDEKHASTQRGRSYSQEGPPTGQLYYSEIDVLAKRKNQIPEVEDAGPHEYAVLEQSHDIVHHDQTDEVIETESNDAYNKNHNHPDSENSNNDSSVHNIS